MSALRHLIKLAAENKVEEFRKVAFVAAPGGEIPPPPGPGGDPGMGPAMGAMPMDPNMGAMPPMDPGMGGMPPMDPGMGGMPPMDPGMGGMPPMDPGMMDPGMMGPPPGEEGLPPEEDPEHINDPNVDWDGSGKPDVMVPLGPITDFATKLIEATKGRRTREADAPKGPGEGGGEEGAPMDPGMMGGPAAHIGGPPAAAPAPIGGMM